MHDPMKDLEGLAARARREAVPPVDVERQVLRRIRQMPEPTDRALLLFAIASFAAAAVVVAISTSLLYRITDPFWTLFEMASTLTP
jgi:hypothetical protein